MTWYRLLLLIAQVDSFLNDLNHYQLILIAPLYCLCYSDVRRGRSRLCSEQHGQYMSTCSIGIFEVSITKIQNVECYVILICLSLQARLLLPPLYRAAAAQLPEFADTPSTVSTQDLQPNRHTPIMLTYSSCYSAKPRSTSCPTSPGNVSASPRPPYIFNVIQCLLMFLLSASGSRS